MSVSKPNGNPDFEEVVAAAPSPRPLIARDHTWAMRLAEKLAAMSNGHAILHRKAYSVDDIAVLRSEIQHLGWRLITRSRPGETYFWRGDKYGNATNQVDGVISTYSKHNRKRPSNG